MFRLAEFRVLEQQLATQLAELETLKNDDALKREMEFETKLRDLLGEHGYSLRNIIAILDPPHSGEVVENKGGNHKVLKEWRAEYGFDKVEAWLAQ